MNIKIKEHLSLTFFCFFLFSCTEEIPLDLPEGEQEVVVNALISNDQPFSLFLTKTIPITDETFPVVDNAVITLSDADTEQILDTLIYDKDFRYKGSNDLDLSKKNLQLNIQLDGKKLQATTYIPEPVLIQSVTSILPSGYDKYGDPIKEYQITFNDPPEEENYYELFYFRYSYSTFFDKETSSYTPNEHLAFIDPVIQAEGLESYNNKSLLFSDRLLKRGSNTITVKYYGLGQYFIAGSLIDTSQLVQGKSYALLRTVSREYYEFRRSWTQHSYTQQIKPAVLEGEPLLEDISHFLFTGDPTRLYSTVTNGLGAFAGYSQHIKEVEEIVNWKSHLPQK